MPNLTSVGVTSGVPTSGTGTVSTIDQLLAAGSPIFRWMANEQTPQLSRLSERLSN